MTRTSPSRRYGLPPGRAHQFILGLRAWTLHDADDSARATAIQRLHDTMVEHVAAAGVLFRSEYGRSARVATRRSPQGPVIISCSKGPRRRDRHAMTCTAAVPGV